MKVLVVSTVQTHPTTSGSGKFIKEYCELLQEMGHDVYFLLARYYTFTKEQSVVMEEGNNGTRKHWGNHFFYYKAPMAQRFVEMFKYKWRELANHNYYHCDDHYPIGLAKYVQHLNDEYHFDACLVNYFWLTKIFNYLNIPRKGLIAHDSFTFNNIRNNVKSKYNLLPNEEAKALQRCDTIFAMQNEEAILFKRLSPRSNVLTSYCSYRYTPQQITGNHNMVLLSSAFNLNVNGLRWFLQQVFPAILKAFPDTKIILGGSICNIVKDLENNPHIKMLGYVEKPEDFYALGDISFNPTYQGTGLKIKTFEAIAYDKVTMVHPHSMGGIFKEEKAPLFASDKATEWVEYLREIWGDKTRISEIKMKNRKYIEEMNAFIKEQYISFLN